MKSDILGDKNCPTMQSHSSILFCNRDFSILTLSVSGGMVTLPSIGFAWGCLIGTSRKFVFQIVFPCISVGIPKCGEKCLVIRLVDFLPSVNNKSSELATKNVCFLILLLAHEQIYCNDFHCALL